ncbi:MAG: polysaccharide deacetylase family protein [Acidobacteriota bacterium]
MRSHDPVKNYLEGLVLCRRHPARQATGFCDICRRSICRECFLAGHPCPGAPAEITRPRRKGRAPARSARIVLGLFLAGLTTGSGVLGPANHAEPARPNAGSARRLLPRPVDSPILFRQPARPAGPKGRNRVSSTAAEEVIRLPSAATSPTETPARAAASISSRTRLPSFNRGGSARRAIVLTFDGGSRSDGAAEILDILARARIRTTFFLTGEFIRRNPSLVLRLVGDGHEIGNHTDTHPHLTLWATRHRHITRPEVNRARLVSQLQRAAAAFREVTGRDMAPLWRAPYGEYNQEILSWATQAGWRHVGWTRSLDTLDWVADPSSHIYRSANEIARRLLSLAAAHPSDASGSIVLMHLGSERPWQERVARVLPHILHGYQQRGFEFITASDMIHGL